MDYLAETFWQQQFFESQRIRDHVGSLLEKGGVLPLQLLAEEAVRLILQEQERLDGLTIYSPERIYHVGDVLAFLSAKGIRHGLVVHIDAGHVAPVARVELSYDAIFVRFKTPHSVKEYVSNCPAFPTRFWYNEASEGKLDHGQVLTPGQIVTKFSGVILPAVRGVLTADSRFCTFDGDAWMLSQYLTKLGEEMTQRVVLKLRESESASVQELASLLFGMRGSESQRAELEFSVSYHLSQDSGRRFTMTRTTSGVAWMLTPPPKHVVCTLDQDMISNGFLRVSGEFQKIVDFYGMTSVVEMQVYGGYLLRSIYDSSVRLIHGDDVRCWLEENALCPGHKVYLRSPDGPGQPVILFSEFEHQGPRETERQDHGERPRLFLRHKIYGTLIEAKEWLHYREICNRLVAGGLEAKPDSVEGVLSSNGHIFARLGPAHGLWGLARWVSERPPYAVNIQSLALTISEEKWVHKILTEAAAPLSPRDINRRLAEIFCVELETIRQLTVMDAKDPELYALADGCWALTRSISEWKETLTECERILRRCRQLHDSISSAEGNLEACRDTLLYLEEHQGTRSATDQQLTSKIRELRKEIERLRTTSTPFSPEIRSSESEIVLLERRRAKLARWRGVTLACSILAMSSLLVEGHRALQVAAVFVSAAAFLTALGSHRRVLNVLKSERDRLQNLTAGSGAVSIKLERAQCDLRGAEEESARSRDYSTQIGVELTETRSKMDDIHQLLATLQGELQRLEEPRVAEDRRHLRQLLMSCSEVSHDSSK